MANPPPSHVPADSFHTKNVMGRSGTGPGMAVVWGTVKDHNGCIGIESVEGRGATFKLFFPVARGAVAAETPRFNLDVNPSQQETLAQASSIEALSPLVETRSCRAIEGRSAGGKGFQGRFDLPMHGLAGRSPVIDTPPGGHNLDYEIWITLIAWTSTSPEPAWPPPA